MSRRARYEWFQSRVRVGWRRVPKQQSSIRSLPFSRRLWMEALEERRLLTGTLAALAVLVGVISGGAIGPVLTGKRTTFPAVPVFLTRHLPFLRAVPAYIVAIGPRPEHAPAFARRPNQP